MFYVFIIILIAAVFGGAVCVDIRNKKTMPNQVAHTHPGEASNYMAGDNKYLHSGQ